MIKTTLYKVTNTVNNMCYYGIVYAKGKTIYDRFEEHMTGKGGSFLYREGVQKFGRDSFSITALAIGHFSYIKLVESSLNKTNLWPAGYNGNSSHALILTPNQHIQITNTKRQTWQEHSEQKPIPPNWKGKLRSDRMKARLSNSKKGHQVSLECREKLRKANLGKTYSKETIEKRLASSKLNTKSYNRQHWLAIKDNTGHYTFGNRSKLFTIIKCAASTSFYNNLNTGIPVSNKSPINAGWTFYNDYQIISQLLLSLPQVTTYET